jgi:hypothetical protein
LLAPNIHFFLCLFQARDFAWVYGSTQSGQSFNHVGHVRDARNKPAALANSYSKIRVAVKARPQPVIGQKKTALAGG